MTHQWKLGLAPVATGLDMADNLALIKGAGFDATFFNWNPEKTEAWTNAAARVGLFVQSIHAPFSGECRVSHMWKRGEEGRAVADKLIACVTDCANHGVPVMVIHPFIGFKDHTPTQVGLDNYARVVEAANKLGVTLGFENVEGEEYLAALMKAFWNEPSLGFCFDTGHELCYNGGHDMLALYGDKLCHTHLNDNLGVYDPTLTWENDLHLVPLDGIVNFAGVLARIEKTSYRGPLLAELTLTSKPGRSDHDKYRAMGAEGFYTFAHERLKQALFQ
ncbi:MAG: sugar phosphate isomerase/epimerase [Clostridia bacterium]|nr:sugar phosphate isomerase/epimerase [Clostridia bacterium]